MNYSKIDNIKALICLILFIFLFSITIGKHYSYVTNLSGQYLMRSLTFFLNQEIITFSRGPIYPILISFFYSLFGFDFTKAVYLHYLFYCLTIILVFFISKNIFDNYVGSLAVIITALSHSLLNVALSVEVSFVLTFFTLLTLYFLIQSEKKYELKYFVYAGVSIALGYMTKEIALFYFFCPFLIFIFKKYRKRFYFKGLTIYFLFFLVTISPWVIFAYLNESLIELIGEFREGQGASIKFYGETNYLVFIIKSLIVGFFNSFKYLAALRELSVLYLLAVSYIFFKDFVFDKKIENVFFNSYLLIAFLFLAPFGLFLDGARQISINIIMLNIAVSYFIIQITKTLKKKSNIQYFTTIFILIIFSLSILILAKEQKQVRNFNEFGFEIIPTGRLNNDLKSLAKTINDKPIDKLCFNMKSDHSLMYLSKLKYEYIRPKLYSYLLFQNFSDVHFKERKNEIIQIRPHPNYKLNQNRYLNLEVLYKKDLYNYFKTVEQNNCLLITSKESSVLDEFLSEDWIEHKNKYTLYSIKDFKSIYLKIENYNSEKIINSFLQSDYSKFIKNNFEDKFRILNNLN